jgi:Protein of unknown function (DUF3987)
MTKTSKILPNGSLNYKQLTQEVFEDLPELLKLGVNTLTDFTEKEVFLYGALGSISASMLKVEGLYDGKFYTPHLYIYVLDSTGIGKNALAYSKQTVAAIDAQIKEQNEGTAKYLFLPVSTSSTRTIELMASNDSNGLIFEMESYTLAKFFKSNFGNHSDIFRKAFGHETISFSRIRDNKKTVYIERPHLSMVLSSNLGNFSSFIPTAEDTLFSRFMFYEVTLNPKNTWKEVFSKENYDEIFKSIGERFLAMYQQINGYEGIEVALSKSQEDFFNLTFSTWRIGIYSM